MTPPLDAVLRGANGARALLTTRRGGVSVAPYDSLNLGDHVGDDPAAVAANRARLLEALRDDGVERIAWLNQVHGSEVVDLDAWSG